ncbi:MAG TPA: hypothetical protein VN256_03670 [Pyrinomonadaceae bacterium]|nr:hypothetical protein [Pyrinomonadaceae bacterium]
MSLRDFFFKANKKFLPASTYFDNLYSEYKSLTPTEPISDDDRKLFEQIYSRRHDRTLPRDRSFSWDDIYTFELTLLKYLPLEEMRNKVVTLRAAYLNIFGQDKYKTYLDTAPPDPAQAGLAQLQAGARYLLHQIFLSLGALSSRDGLGKTLTLWAAYMLAVAAIVIGTLLWLMHMNLMSGTSIAVAFFAGAMGGLLSILHRLQAVPTEGDPIYGLAAFWHGSYALFVSPLTGSVFGGVLYLAIAGGLLQGRIFPRIVTPSGQGTESLCGRMTTAPPVATTSSPTPRRAPASPRPTARPRTSPAATATTTPVTGSPSATVSPSPAASPSPTVSPSQTPSPSPTPSPESSPSPSVSPSPATSPSPADAARQAASPPEGRVSLKQFLACSDPETGFDYALMIIWCFLAGFAERLVPDTLNRLVDENTSVRVKKQ